MNIQINPYHDYQYPKTATNEFIVTIAPTNILRLYNRLTSAYNTILNMYHLTQTILLTIHTQHTILKNYLRNNTFPTATMQLRKNHLVRTITLKQRLNTTAVRHKNNRRVALHNTNLAVYRHLFLERLTTA